MARLSAGSSPSHRMAVSFARWGRCRSMQLAETFSTPSANQRMRKSSLLNDTSLISVGDSTQSSRAACSAQKASGACRAAVRAAS